MQSLNFEFLRPKYAEMADLGAFAERYVWSDPSSAAVKLRSFGELLTGAIYHRLRLPRPEENEFVSLLCAPEFKAAVPVVIQDTLHGLRKEGNQAAHGGSIPGARAGNLLRDAFNLSRWWAAAALGLRLESLAAFQLPAMESRPTPEAPAQEAELDNTVKTALGQQQQYEPIIPLPEQLAAARADGQQTADLLHISEAETRQCLIDRDLARAGWKVGHHGGNTSEVTQEHIIPNGTRADYVLWEDNGKPLAVIEAKKTSRDIEAGRRQAFGYADELEKQFQQRPVIFTTNGPDISIWEGEYPPRSLFGFYSKDSLQFRLYQRAAKKPLATVTIDPAITDRLYQIEAIRRVSERFTANFRKALLVQATGTGRLRIAPLAFSLSQLALITCPEGRVVSFTPRAFKRSMSALYGFNTFKLLAFGCGVFESHQTCSTESFTRTRRTVTHSAGTGIFAGLYQ